MSGIAIEFAEEGCFVAAAARLRALGLTRVEAYSSYPVEALDEILPRAMVALPVLVFVCGVLSLVAGFGMQWYGAAVGYPLNIGGRPYASWPAFIPIAFEITVLGAILAGFFGFFALARLPRPYQPLAAIPGFERVTQDRFFLLVDAEDPACEPETLVAAVEEFAPCAIVPWSP